MQFAKRHGLEPILDVNAATHGRRQRRSRTQSTRDRGKLAIGRSDRTGPVNPRRWRSHRQHSYCNRELEGLYVNHLGCPPPDFKGAPTKMVKTQALIGAVWAINAARGWQRFSPWVAPIRDGSRSSIPVIPVHGGAARPILRFRRRMIRVTKRPHQMGTGSCTRDNYRTTLRRTTFRSAEETGTGSCARTGLLGRAQARRSRGAVLRRRQSSPRCPNSRRSCS